MDEQFRQNAKSTIEAANRLRNYRYSTQKTLDKYLEGINHYLNISNKNSDDLMAIASAYHDMGNIYFNSDNDFKAAEHYVYSIQYLQQIPPDDKVYRTLTKRYIDLADAYYELFNQPAGDEAMTHAIQAFQLIKEKNAKEVAIGDPAIHFKEFHNYYEHQLSDVSYTSTVQFMNHQHLLGEGQQEQALLSQFDGISIDEMKQLDDSLEVMLTQLSASDRPRVRTFFNQVVGDGDYRNTASALLRMAQSHLKSNSIKSARVTYEQAIEALRLIRSPNEQDKQTIANLTEQTVFLQSKLYQAKPSFTLFAPVLDSSSEDSDEMEESESRAVVY